jgi:hypothetical protein
MIGKKSMDRRCILVGIIDGWTDHTTIRPQLQTNHLLPPFGNKICMYIFKSVYNSYKRLVFHALKAEPGEVKCKFYFRTEEVLCTNRK